jgi:hypothetical protein
MTLWDSIKYGIAGILFIIFYIGILLAWLGSIVMICVWFCIKGVGWAARRIMT